MEKAFSIIVSASIILGAFDANAFRLVDAETKAPLPLASINDRYGNVLGMTEKSGVNAKPLHPAIMRTVERVNSL